MKKFGIKLWSSDFTKNKDFVNAAEKLLKEGTFGYLELFALPETYQDNQQAAMHFKDIKTIIHAPHAKQNFNPSNPEELANNQHKLLDSQKFADLLDATIIITHPGFRDENSGGIDENLRQFKSFKEPRLTVENMPDYCSSTHRNLEGANPQDIKRFIDETKCQFCLDFSHAICSANSRHQDIYEILTEFNALKPAMYHLCDGHKDSTIDAHLNYGQGNYDLKRLMLDYTSDAAMITMETDNPFPMSIQKWLNDLSYLKRLLS